MPEAPDAPTPGLRVSEVGEYIRHGSCERRFKLEHDNRKLAKRLPFSDRLFNTIDPVLKAAGRAREDEWERSLVDEGFSKLGADAPEDGGSGAWAQIFQGLEGLPPGARAYAREVTVSGPLGAFEVRGRIDFVVVRWVGGRPRIRLVECKASRRDRTYQRLQVAIYSLLVEQQLEGRPVEIGGVRVLPEDVECVVARLDESTSRPQSILSLNPLDLTLEKADARRLLDDGGPLTHVLGVELDDLPYHLGPRCDGCVFNVDCFPESARLRRPQLLGLDPSSVRALGRSGVETIDDLAGLDLSSPAAGQLRADPSLTESLPALVRKARARRTTLPGGSEDPDDYQVMWLDGTQSQLPEHTIDGVRLVRVYLSVSYDYVENRIGALAAHVTTSEGDLVTGILRDDQGQAVLDDKGWVQRRPEPYERVPSGGDGDPAYEERPLSGTDIVQIRPSPWTGRYEEDNGAEKQLIQSFLHDLIGAIADEAPQEEVPIHFYVWSRSEMAQLTEACSRVGSDLLGALRQLLGCRESLEQLLYSSLQQEVDRRYALGWTGRGLAVVTSLTWFGQRYHWHRRVAGRTVDLAQAFTQDLFDFKTDLRLTDGGGWAEGDEGERHKFEIRSRYFDSLTAPYWRAIWHDLPDPDEEGDPRVAASIRRYNQAAQPGMLKSYLQARTHALRWVDGRVRFKNPDIAKPRLRVAELPQFSLGVDSTRQAALDFLRLDQHVRVTDWIGTGLAGPASRVPGGRTVPLRNVTKVEGSRIRADIDVTAFPVDLEVLRGRSSFQVGSFVRVTPCFDDPDRGQTVPQLLRGGTTCVIVSLDWDRGTVQLDMIWQPSATRYRLRSGLGGDDGDVLYDYATIDESPSDYVSDRVDGRLVTQTASPIYDWFHPRAPVTPAQSTPDDDDLNAYRHLLDTLRMPEGYGLTDDQKSACLTGLSTRVQLLLGPPGTGKTETTAVSQLLRIVARRQPGDVVLLSAHTHSAVNTLLRRLDEVKGSFVAAAESAGLRVPDIQIVKVDSRHDDLLSGGVGTVPSTSCVRQINSLRRSSVLVLGGTTNALLKLAAELHERSSFPTDPRLGLQVPSLVVDEASMMVFPHFLALATLVSEDGEVMLAGDHRQLAPIVAHDWEHEDRPPVEVYKPFVSAYEAVRSIAQREATADAEVCQSELNYTHRLPPDVRALVSVLYEQLDNVSLEGRPFPVAVGDGEHGSLWEHVMHGENGLYLIVHDERASRQSNEAEAAVIERLLCAAGHLERSSVAVVTPHRAQRTYLRERLAPHGESIHVIDTVEKVQGEGVETVIVSGTVSDPAAVTANARFILNLNRANVAFSRSKRRLVVVVARTLLDHIPPELEDYQSALLWKTLREMCDRPLGEEAVDVVGGPSVRAVALTPSRNELPVA